MYTSRDHIKALLYVCLFAVVYSASAIPSKLPHACGLGKKLQVKENDYGIVGGKTEDIKKHPYTVSLYSDVFDRLIGGGVILNKYWVLCSKYEITRLHPHSIVVRYGSSNAGEGYQYVNVTGIFSSAYFAMDYPYDLAVLRTTQPMNLGPKAKGVKMAKSLPKTGTVAKVTGFGKSLDPSEPVMNLKVASVKVLSDEECEKHYTSLNTSFCAEADGVGPCSSDIGDPLVYKNRLIGLYIGGDICDYYGVPDLYTNIPYFRQWILDIIKENSNDDEMEGIFDGDDYSSDGNDDDNDDKSNDSDVESDRNDG